MRRRRGLASVVVAFIFGLGGFALAPGASAQDGYGEDKGSSGAGLFDANGNRVTQLSPGDSFVVTCTNEPCADDGANVKVSLSSDPVVLGNMTADSDGGYSGTFRIPTNTTLGQHSIIVETTLDGDPVFYSRAITIVAAGGVRLPITGRDIALLAAWGVALIGLGTTLVLTTRRFLRRRRSAIATADPTTGAKSVAAQSTDR